MSKLKIDTSRGVGITLADDVDEDFDPNAEIATEVLASELGDFYSREDEELAARTWEITNGRPLKRSWVTWAEWETYKKKFKPSRTPKPYTMDRQTALEQRARLLKVEQPSEAQQQEIHDLEELLDIPATDFSKPRPKPEDAEKVAIARFEAIETLELWPDRLKMVTKERDIGCLNLIAKRDTHETVRATAQQRILELTIAR